MYWPLTAPRVEMHNWQTNGSPWSPVVPYRKGQYSKNSGVNPVPGFWSLQDGNLNHPPEEGPWWTSGEPPVLFDPFTDYFYDSYCRDFAYSIRGIYARKGTFNPNQWAEIETDAGGLGPTVRANAATNSCYIAWFGEETVRLYRRVGGVSTLLTTWSVPMDPETQMPIATRLGIVGSKLYLAARIAGSGVYDPYEDNLAGIPWVDIGTYTDTGPALTGGAPGIWCPRNTPPWPDIGPGDGTTHFAWGEITAVPVPGSLPDRSVLVGGSAEWDVEVV